LKAGVPAENFKGVQAFGSNAASLESLNEELIDCREKIEKMEVDLAKLRDEGDKKQKNALKLVAAIQSASKLYRKASIDMEKGFKMMNDSKAAQASSQLRAGLDNIDAMTDKNMNLTYKFK
jgi:predicted  nucleic acid-binding Zn-ribbon protein